MSKITRRNFLKVSGVAAAAAALTACGGSSSTASSAASGAASSEAASTAAKLDKIKVAVPNDTTNEARALTLLEKNGFFKLKADAGLTATKNDIEENPLNVNVDEVEAAQVPNVLQDEDYAVINSNYAISAGLDPMTDALAMEDGTSAYVNVLVCKEGNEEEPKIKALVAALQSQQVKDFMTESYGGAVVSVVENPTDGYDPSIDYDALNGETVSCAATPAPHCEILEVCKQILADKGYEVGTIKNNSGTYEFTLNDVEGAAKFDSSTGIIEGYAVSINGSAKLLNKTTQIQNLGLKSGLYVAITDDEGNVTYEKIAINSNAIKDGYQYEDGFYKVIKTVGKTGTLNDDNNITVAISDLDANDLYIKSGEEVEIEVTLIAQADTDFTLNKGINVDTVTSNNGGDLTGDVKNVSLWDAGDIAPKSSGTADSQTLTVKISDSTPITDDITLAVTLANANA